MWKKTRGEAYRLRGNGIPICIHWTVCGRFAWEKNAFVASFLLYVLAAVPVKRGPTSGRAFASRIIVPRVSFPWVRLVSGFVWEPARQVWTVSKERKRKREQILQKPVSD